jgi:hypothetical protein
MNFSRALRREHQHQKEAAANDGQNRQAYRFFQFFHNAIIGCNF